jgi:hypothetical protein
MNRVSPVLSAMPCATRTMAVAALGGNRPSGCSKLMGFNVLMLHFCC